MDTSDIRTIPALEDVADSENLRAAWERVRDNDGAPGPDRVTIAAYSWFTGIRLWWLRNLLLSRWYRPGRLRPVFIPKKDGVGWRRLDIPSVRDRVVGAALNRVLVPLYERRFLPASHGYRPRRGVESALWDMRRHVSRGWTWALDADIRSCFPSIGHGVLLALLSDDIADRRMVELIRRMLRASIPWLPFLLGRRRGCPQGSPLSPLLCNRLLHELDLHVRELGLRLVRYADDFVVLCRSREQAERARELLDDFLRRRLELSLHPGKTRILPASELHFLGQDVFPGKASQVDSSWKWPARVARWLFRLLRPDTPGRW